MENKLWVYQDPSGTHIASTKQVLETYMPYWSKRMLLAGKGEHITEDNCLEDWCTVYYAWDITSEEERANFVRLVTSNNLLEK